MRSHSPHNRDPQPKPDSENIKETPKEKKNKKEGVEEKKNQKEKKETFLFSYLDARSVLNLVTLLVPKVELYSKPGAFIIYFSVIENKQMNKSYKFSDVRCIDEQNHKHIIATTCYHTI